MKFCLFADEVVGSSEGNYTIEWYVDYPTTSEHWVANEVVGSNKVKYIIE